MKKRKELNPNKLKNKMNLLNLRNKYIRMENTIK